MSTGTPARNRRRRHDRAPGFSPCRWLTRSGFSALGIASAFFFTAALSAARAAPSHDERNPHITVGRTDPGQLLAPFFHPPAQYADQFGSYRSPLKFEDGTWVKTAADWARRRQEIRKQWHDLMGPWPPLPRGAEGRIPASSQAGVRSAAWTSRQDACSTLGGGRQDACSTGAREFRAPPGSPGNRPGQTGEGWLLVPEGEGHFPAVLVLYYEPETSVGLGRAPPDFGLQLARRGFVTLSIGTPGGNAWKPELGSAQCQPLSYHAYVAANCWRALANLPQVDSARIGVVGHSYGGKWAMFAGALWERFAAVAVSDPGVVFDETRPNVNYWEPWYLGLDADEKPRKAGLPTADNPRTGAYKRMVETGRDLHELHALIAPRPFLVSGGSEDPPARWLALNHLLAVNQLLGRTNRVVFTSRAAHTPTAESNEQICAFFEHFLNH